MIDGCPHVQLRPGSSPAWCPRCDQMISAPLAAPAHDAMARAVGRTVAYSYVATRVLAAWAFMAWAFCLIAIVVFIVAVFAHAAL